MPIRSPKMIAPSRGIHRASFDHLVGLGEQRGRHVEAERLCGLEVENKAKAGRLLERQFSGIRSFENGVYEGCQAVETLIQIRTIRHQATVADEEVELIHGWEPMHGRELVNAPAVEVGEYIRDHENSIGHFALHRRKCLLKIFGLAHAQRLDADPQSLGTSL